MASAGRRLLDRPLLPPPAVVALPRYFPMQGRSRGRDSTGRTSRTPASSPFPLPPAAPHARRRRSGRISSVDASVRSHGRPSCVTDTSADKTQSVVRGSAMFPEPRLPLFSSPPSHCRTDEPYLILKPWKRQPYSHHRTRLYREAASIDSLVSSDRKRISLAVSMPHEERGQPAGRPLPCIFCLNKQRR